MPTAPFKVKAVYDYNSAEPDDLNFPNGQIITVTAEEDDDWYSGEYADSTGQRRVGIFPKNFVEKYEPAVPSRPSRPTRAKQDTEAAATTAAPPAQTSSVEDGVEKSVAPPAESTAPPTTALDIQGQASSLPPSQTQKPVQRSASRATSTSIPHAANDTS